MIRRAVSGRWVLDLITPTTFPNPGIPFGSHSGRDFFTTDVNLDVVSFFYDKSGGVITSKPKQSRRKSNRVTLSPVVRVLAELRKARNMSSDDSAFKSVGLSSQTIERIDKGTNQPNLETLEKYAKALKLTIALRNDNEPGHSSLQLSLPKQQVFAVYNHAGGVGKTSLTRDLGFAISQVGYRVLLIDLDPQANLTTWLSLPQPIPVERTAFGTIMGDEREPILPTPYTSYGMDIIASSIRLNRIDRGSVHGRRRRLKHAIASTSYDIVLIDMNPSITNLTEIGLTASTSLIVPMPTSQKGIDAFQGIVESLEEARNELNPNLDIAMFVLTHFNANTAIDQELRSQLREIAEPIAPIAGPLNAFTVYREAIGSGMPVAVQDPKHVAVEQISKVATQFLDLINTQSGGKSA
jgi:chromosome partitioning protein